MKFRNNNIILMGDTHNLGNVSKLIYEKIPPHWDVFHVGDVGVGFQEYSKNVEELEMLNSFLQDKNVKFYCIRGNHDNPSWWENPLELSNFIFVPDYSTIEFPSGHRVLCVGGSISIDRSKRHVNIDYWEGEGTNPATGIEKHDFVFSHDCPSFVHKRTASLKRKYPHYLVGDKKLYADCERQRQIMDDILYETEANEWYFGHYHKRLSSKKKRCQFRCLGVNEVTEFCSVKDNKYKSIFK